MIGEITINRAPHNPENPYVMTRRDSAQDSRLSYEAAGLLLCLLSKPNDWIIKAQTLVREGCTIKKVYRLFNELIATGYMTRKEKRDDRGRFVEWVYQVFEEPQVIEQNHPLGKKSTHGQIHQVDNPHVGNSTRGKSARLLNKDKEPNTEIPQRQTDTTSSPASTDTPTPAVLPPVSKPEPEPAVTQAQVDALLLKAQPADSGKRETPPPASAPPPSPDEQEAQRVYEGKFGPMTADSQKELFGLVASYGLIAVNTGVLQIDNRKIKTPLPYLRVKLAGQKAEGKLPGQIFSQHKPTPDEIDPPREFMKFNGWGSPAPKGVAT